MRFGTASNYVSNPRKTARDRAAYIARHRVNENHGDPLTPGALSSEVAAVGREQEPSPQHGRVQAASSAHREAALCCSVGRLV